MVKQGLRSRTGIAASPYTNGPYTWSEDVTFYGRISESPERYGLSEDYAQRPMLNASVGIAANVDFEILGTNVAEANVTWATTIGGLELKTATTSGDQVIVLPHLDTLQSAWTGVKWGTENQVIWEAVIRTGASVAAVVIWAGLKLTNTSVVATDDDQAFFRFDASADTNWKAIYSIGGTDSSNDTGVAVAANTNVYFRIELDSDRKAHFFINEVEVLVSTALTNDVDLIPYVGVQTGAAAAKIINLVSQRISRIIFE